MKTLLAFILLYISVFVASAQRISDFPNNAHPANSDLMLFQSGNTNFNTTFSQLQTALSTNIGTSSNSINAVYVTHNPLTNSILGNAATASSSTNFFGLLSNTNLPNPLDLSHGSNLPPTAITSGGAVSGQTLSWNGLYWVPVTPTAGTNSAATNVVWPVIGDTHLIGVTNGFTVTMTVPWSPITNEFWVSSVPVTNPDGTQLRPLDGSTMAKFDLIMTNLTSTNNTVAIHLLPGTFVTHGYQPGVGGAWTIKSNQRIVGSGKYMTTIKNMDSGLINSYVVNSGSVFATNMDVSDLTIDCNGQSNVAGWGSGIYLYGKDNTIHRVRVINCVGTLPNKEGFSIAIGSAALDGSGSDIASQASVVECTIEDVVGNYVDGVVTSGGSVTIDRCAVSLPVVTDTSSNYFFAAYNLNWGRGMRVVNSFAHGGYAAVYSDTGTLTNTVISHNVFSDCIVGVALNHGGVNPGVDDFWAVDKTDVADNIIQLATHAAAPGVWKAALYSERHIVNVSFHDNLVSGGISHGDSAVAYMNQGTGLKFYHNIWNDVSLGFQPTWVTPPVITNLLVFDNWNPAGVLVTNVLQTNVINSVVANNFIGNGVLITNVPLSALSQSGALVGYMPSWNGSAWVATVPPSGGGSGTGIQTNSGSGINNTFTNVTIVSGSIYGGAVTSVVGSATTAVTASSVIAGITNTWRTDATNAAAFYSQSATNVAALNAMGFALLSDATNAANKASQNSTNTTRLNANGLALLTDVTNEANYATQNSTNTTKLNANGLALKTDATNAALGSIAPYAINATNVLVNIITNKIDGTNLISGGPVAAGLVPVADGTGKVAWGGVNASQSPLTNNVNAMLFSGTNYGTLQATNFDINGTGEPVLSLYDAGGNLMAGFVSSNWFGNGAGLSNVVQGTFNVTKTANYTVTSADNGTRFNNFGAGAAVTNTLPASSVNLHFYFIVAAANNLTVKASNPDTIWYGGHQSAAGGFINSLTRGDVVHIFCPVTNQWFCDGVSPNPNWSAP